MASNSHTSSSPLARLGAAELRYDGAIPCAELQAILHGSEKAVLLEAVGHRAFFGRLAARQRSDVIRPRRADGSLAPYMLDDLKSYRQQFAQWNRRVRELRAAERLA
jgi:hypothetical protein